jgi:hypothetical protein
VRTLLSSLERALLGAAVLAALCLPLRTPAWAQTGPESTSPSSPAGIVAAEADKVHVLLVGDTLDRNVGAQIGNDVRAFQRFLATAERADPGLRGRLEVTILAGRNADPAQVRAYFNNLKCGPNDNLFFFLCCHGVMLRGLRFPEEAHILVINSGLREPREWLPNGERLLEGMMQRSEVRRMMEAKRPRGLVLLTNVCSSYGPNDGAEPDFSVLRAEPGPGPNAATVRGLLFHSPRLVDITATQDGCPALADHVGSAFGGAASAFTVSLLHLLCEPGRAFRSWEELWPALGAETLAASGRLQRPRLFGLREQPAPSARGAPPLICWASPS